MKDQRSRRDFIKSATLSAAGLAFAANAASYARILGANDRVRVGIVGFSDRTRDALIPAFLQYAKELNFDLVAVSDIWNRRREEGAAFIGEQRARVGLPPLDIFRARNNDELYDRKDVDAVIIATTSLRS